MSNKKSHISYEERFCIERLLKANCSVSFISRILERGVSTINKEIKLNSINSMYVAAKAQERANNGQRVKKQMANKVVKSHALRLEVDRMIKAKMTPEKISRELLGSESVYRVSSKSIRKYILYINKH